MATRPFTFCRFRFVIRFMNNSATVERCVEQMVAVALHHGFEGPPFVLGEMCPCGLIMRRACVRVCASPEGPCSCTPLPSRTHRRPGWLINIENEVDWEGGTELIIAFLELLTRRMHEALPGPDYPEEANGSPALVLWYDSVVADTGELKWQDGAWGRAGRVEAWRTGCAV